MAEPRIDPDLKGVVLDSACELATELHDGGDRGSRVNRSICCDEHLKWSRSGHGRVSSRAFQSIVGAMGHLELRSHPMRRYFASALAGVTSGTAACATNPRPVPVYASPADWEALAGRWRGSYTTSEPNR